MPAADGVCGWQPPTGSQGSRVHGLLSLQLRSRPRRQTPALHVSSPLQTLPSEHEVPSGTGVWWQPRSGSQESVVQAFASLQLRSSTWQNTEQPSQLFTTPGTLSCSQVSGNSTTPFPQVGQGTRQLAGVAEVQVADGWATGAGVMVAPVIDAVLRWGKVRTFLPFVPAVRRVGVFVVASN